MVANRNKFGEQYFEWRRQNPNALLKGNKDISFLKYLLWDRVVRKRVPQGRLLDAGCGEGRFLRWAERRGYDTYGIDISEFAVAKLSKHQLRRAKLLVAEVGALPFRDRFFDVIVCFDVLEHLADPIVALLEVNRCLRRDGWLILTVPNTSSLGARVKGGRWHGRQDPTHVSLLSVQQWRGLLGRSGLVITDEFYDSPWDSPYFGGVPAYLQHAVFKPSCLAFWLLNIKFPKALGETLWLVSGKGG